MNAPGTRTAPGIATATALLSGLCVGDEPDYAAAAVALAAAARLQHVDQFVLTGLARLGVANALD